MFADNDNRPPHFVIIHSIVFSDGNFVRKIYQYSIALIPNVDVRRFVVVRVDFEIESVFSENGRHFLILNLAAWVFNVKLVRVSLIQYHRINEFFRTNQWQKSNPNEYF